jgi:hypothetical protein
MSMDGKTIVIDPLAIKELEPAGEVELSKGPKDLSEEDISGYAKRTGVDVIKIKDLARRSSMGELVARLGAAKVGSSMLVDSEAMIKEGIEMCDNLLSEYAHDSKLVGSIMKVRLGFVDLWVKAAQTHIKSRKDAGPEGSEQKPQQTPFPPPAPLQINIQQNAVSQDKSQQ